MFKKLVMIVAVLSFHSTSKAYVQRCVKVLESDADVTRLKHKEIDTLIHDLIRSVDTRNMDAMVEVHDACHFLNNTDYTEARKALHWLTDQHNTKAAQMKRPKLKNKRIADYL